MGLRPETTACTPSIPSDEAFVALLIRGDEAAWRLFHLRYDRLVYCCITRVTGKFPNLVGADDVEEIYAEVLYQLLRRDRKKLRAYRSDRGARLSTWIGLISVNAAYDHLRRLQRRPTLAVGGSFDAAANVPDPAPGPFERVLARQGWRALRGLLEHLTAKDRRFVLLYFVEGLPPEEVARRMGISIKTVYSKKHKVRRRLAGMIEAPALAA